MEKGSSSSVKGGPGSPNGLQFGKRVYYEEGSGPGPKSGGGPGKRGRAGAGLMVQGYCQVEGCKVDLSGAKAYYSRHKVCGVHSKSPRVIVAGIDQRFCQQCSRFHQLPEFDQGKRSCRRRLAGHNERRRKPPQGYKNIRPSVFDNNLTSKTRGFVMDFGAYPSSHTGRDPFSNSALEQGLTTNRDSITGRKSDLPWPSNSHQNPLSDLLTSRPSYSVGPPALSSQECFDGVSDSGNAPSLLSNQPLDGPKGRLVVNSFLGQPSDNNQFVCSPWIDLKGNGDLGLGQASQPSNDGPYNDELGLAPPSVGQFDELDQTRGYDSSSVGQHMQWSL